MKILREFCDIFCTLFIILWVTGTSLLGILVLFELFDRLHP